MNDDKKKLKLFNKRMGMYIGEVNKTNIVSFLHGYEYGTNSKYKITNRISELLEVKYKIQKRALGWPNQLERFAEQKSIQWPEAYMLISSEILTTKTE